MLSILCPVIISSLSGVSKQLFTFPKNRISQHSLLPLSCVCFPQEQITQHTPSLLLHVYTDESPKLSLDYISPRLSTQADLHFTTLPIIITIPCTDTLQRWALILIPCLLSPDTLFKSAAPCGSGSSVPPISLINAGSELLKIY